MCIMCKKITTPTIEIKGEERAVKMGGGAQMFDDHSYAMGHSPPRGIWRHAPPELQQTNSLLLSLCAINCALFYEEF